MLFRFEEGQLFVAETIVIMENQTNVYLIPISKIIEQERAWSVYEQGKSYVPLCKDGCTEYSNKLKANLYARSQLDKEVSYQKRFSLYKLTTGG